MNNVSGQPTPEELNALWARHHAEWREPAQIVSQWDDAAAIDPDLLRYSVYGQWWAILEQLKVTLLVTREYEHLVMALTVTSGQPTISYLKLPHPSGLAVDLARGLVYIASTRNPNQVYDFAPLTSSLPRLDVPPMLVQEPLLLPVHSRYLPGCLYLHDLAVINGALYANSVGQNAIIRLHDSGQIERVWWPRCIDGASGPLFGQNHIQLNSIAASDSLAASFFSASADEITALRPGHPEYPVDKRGVIFSAISREPIVRGLTRPHSARLHQQRVWVDNSGYGEVGYVDGGSYVPFVKLPGWTRGLDFQNQIAFVGTSRVIPHFRQYAPGLDVDRSQCGIHVVDTLSGQILGGLSWDYGNQIFAIQVVPASFTSGFPFAQHVSREQTSALFYNYLTDHHTLKDQRENDR